MADSGTYGSSIDRIEGDTHPGDSWYLSRREIEENSPSRRDGIDLKKETYLRRSYCTFLQTLGMRLKVPQVTIASAIIFCHRFFLRQSHAKNDSKTMATVCMFLAGKVEETPRPLKDVIVVSYEVIHKKDLAVAQRIKQKDVYEQQKERILLAERVLLVTLGFDFNVHHPYKPLVDAIKRFKVAQNALAQVAWNFVNDGLRTSLCLQFKSHHIAAGAIFLAGKFLKVKLPSDAERLWWKEFDVTARQLEEISNQMLELYEQNQAASFNVNAIETEGTSICAHRSSGKLHGPSDEPTVPRGIPHTAAATKNNYFRSASDHSHTSSLNAHNGFQNEGHSNHTSREMKLVSVDRNNHWHRGSEIQVEHSMTSEKGHKDETKESNFSHNEAPKGGYSPMLKRRKTDNNASKKTFSMVNGVDLEPEAGEVLHEKSGWSKPLNEQESHNQAYESETTEEGELSFDNHDYESPEHGQRKRKESSPPSSAHYQSPPATYQEVI